MSGGIKSQEGQATERLLGLAGAEIEVTPEMIEAGLDELRDHCYGTDAAYLVEVVFRAMAYFSPSSQVVPGFGDWGE